MAQPSFAQPAVVIIGGGIVGASLADEITERGWTDVTVVDGGPLPVSGGSTSHAPGVVFQTNGSKVMSEFAMYTVNKFKSLVHQGDSCYLAVGGLEIATTPERALELERRYGYTQSWGVPGARLLDARETVRTWDLLDPSTVHGGLYVADDGIAKAVRAVAAQLDRARSRGATVLPHHEVLDVLVTGNRVTGVRTDQGDIRADIVVCCAGIWGPKVAAMVGQTLALTPLAHQFAWTGPVNDLAGRTSEAVRPVLRHQDADLYYRENGTGLGIGSYRHRPMPVRSTDLASWKDAAAAGGQPSVLDFTPEDFEFPLAETARILPSLGELELKNAFNGVFSFTTDNMPLLGPHASIDGFWTAEAVWVTHSAGVAKAMAEWIVDGYSRSFDLHACDLNRFERHQLAPAYIEAKDCQNFVEVYDILHPLQPMEHSRPLRTSPFYARELELGGVMLEANGWERPHWYAANDALVTSDRNTGWHIPQPGDWAGRFWSPTIAAEAAVTRTDVAIYDMTALKRIEVTGAGATEFLQSLVTGKMAKSVGSVTYCLMLDIDGGIRSDVTVARLGEEHYQVGANGAIDLDWMRRHLPDGSAVQVRDITAGTCCIGIWGPKARDVVQPLTDTDFSNAGFKYFRAKQAFLGTIEVTAMRLSYVGELGWELYTTADQGLVLWDLLMKAGAEHGIIAAGRGAFNALRIEKGYRSFGGDMTDEHTPVQAGVDFAVKMDQDFLGKDALLTREDDGKRLCLLTIEGENDIVIGSEPVYAVGMDQLGPNGTRGTEVDKFGHADEVDPRQEGRAIGYVTSAAYAYTLGTPLAYAWLPAGYTAPGTSVEIGYFGDRYRAVVTAEPAFDPEMKKIRC
ncbi:Glycine cleavage system T protein (aminomethyltransferase) [Nakamurella panacisegetis]|uniref:Glycine cleavage system T protein (Aminomethyltransferase) n=1 Tax=Nakamurella panacisegetis TaxID=1090615 RepID=A0A1H0MY30_9ACTN|nr:FAD-dependent oxidoreductase [Nakamurella panacisegetis]SDO85195.1 Glycine cleavage system T protein (aminomethyltransferase) [Nakamurella panacisegetis]